MDKLRNNGILSSNMDLITEQTAKVLRAPASGYGNDRSSRVIEFLTMDLNYFYEKTIYEKTKNLKYNSTYSVKAPLLTLPSRYL